MATFTSSSTFGLDPLIARSVEIMNSDCCDCTCVVERDQGKLESNVVCSGCGKKLYMKKKTKTITIPEKVKTIFHLFPPRKEVEITPSYKKKITYTVLTPRTE